MGAPGAGKAFIFAYDRDAGGWASSAVTIASAYTGESGFGSSVSITDNYAIVGAPGAGKAFIFAGSVDVKYIQHGCVASYDERLDDVSTASDGISIFTACKDACANLGYSYFGLECPQTASTYCNCHKDSSINTDGLTAPSTTPCNSYGGLCTNANSLSHRSNNYYLGGQGTSSVYSTTEARIVDWGTSAVTVIDSLVSEGQFGYSVSINEDYAVVGAFGANKAFIFERGPSEWLPTPSRSLVDFMEMSNFGISGALSEKFLMVGSGDGTTSSGANNAVLFKEGHLEAEWSATAVAHHDEFTDLDDYGRVVALTEDYLFVGTQWSPLVHGYLRDSTTGRWRTSGTPEVTFSATVSNFASCMDACDDHVIVSTGAFESTTNYVWLFGRDFNTGAWDTTAKITFSGDQFFGEDVSVSKSFAAVATGSSSGAQVYAFDSDTRIWSLAATLGDTSENLSLGWG